MEEAQRPQEFKPTPAPTDPAQPIDPDGEEAYQRAAIEAAKMKPPRVPNPLAYPNSPTAQAYIRARTQEVPERRPTRVPNPLYVPAPLDIHARERLRLQQLREAEQPAVASTSASGSVPSSTHRELPSLSHYWEQPNGQPPPPYPHEQQHLHQQQQQQHQQPTPDYHFGAPNTMEPQLQAPAGPRNPFR